MKNFMNKIKAKANSLAIRAKTTIDNAKAEGYAIPAVAMFMGVLALNSVCMATYHQQETPDSLNKYRR
jgi:cyclic lactone autoinducer peptide